MGWGAGGLCEAYTGHLLEVLRTALLPSALPLFRLLPPLCISLLPAVSLTLVFSLDFSITVTLLCHAEMSLAS